MIKNLCAFCWVILFPVLSATASTSLPLKVFPEGAPGTIYLPHSLSSEKKALPAVIFLQGAKVNAAAYSQFLSQLADSGMIVLSFDEERSIFFSKPQKFPDVTAVATAWTALQTEAKRPGSPLNHKMNTDAFGVVGHSFGALVGLMAIDGECYPPFCNALGWQKPPKELRAAVFFGATTKNGPITIPVQQRGVAIGLVQGMEDGKAAPEKVKYTYDQLVQPKALFSIRGANHYLITNENNPKGSDPDPHPSRLNQKKSIEVSAQWTAEFLKRYLQPNLKAAPMPSRSSVSTSESGNAGVGN